MLQVQEEGTRGCKFAEQVDREVVVEVAAEVKESSRVPAITAERSGTKRLTAGLLKKMQTSARTTTGGVKRRDLQPLSIL